LKCGMAQTVRSVNCRPDFLETESWHMRAQWWAPGPMNRETL
jgi:hypothetical protein